MTDALLAINAGSSSLKFGLFEFRDADENLRPLVSGVLARHGEQLVLEARPRNSATAVKEGWPTTPARPVTDLMLDWLESQFPHVRLLAVGHRIVHGGWQFGSPVEVNEAVLAALDALTPLAPLHQPLGLEPLRRIRALRPALRHVACFDTAFHRTIMPPASRYALPQALETEGIRRYGFHGISYESIAEQLRRSGDAAAMSPNSRVVVAHLGSGASLCAMRGLKSVDTTMGFSALDGLVMGTRPGSLDPGILLYLMRERGYSGERLEELLYRQSGLLGVSGISSDVATLLQSDSRSAAEALDLFAFQVARHTAALAATLGGIDRVIFTGGIGEHAPAVRTMIVRRLHWLGAELEDGANEAGSTIISTKSSRILLEQRTTEEERMIALHVRSAIGI